MSILEDGQVEAVPVEQLLLSVHLLVDAGLDDLTHRPRQEVLRRGDGDQLVGVDAGRAQPLPGPLATKLEKCHRHLVNLSFLQFLHSTPLVRSSLLS